MFKQGTFINILTPQSQSWKTDLKNLERLAPLDHIEIWLEHIPKGRNLREIRSAFRDFQVIVHGPFLHTSLVSHIPAIVSVTEDRFDEALEFSSKVEARVVTFHAGTYPMFESQDRALEQLARRFDRFCKMKDPITTLENMPISSHGTTKQPLGRLSDYDLMLKYLPDLRFTLDIGHCLQNGDDFVQFLMKHGSRIENIHLHDGIPGGKGHLCLGSGTLDLNSFLDTLVRIQFDKFVSIETISLDDTRSSWETLCRTESDMGIRLHENRVKYRKSPIIRRMASVFQRKGREG